MNKFIKFSLGIVTSLSMAIFFTGSSFAQSNNQGLATWPYQVDSKCYQIFYKESGAASWQFSVHCRDTKNPAWQYMIKYLKPGVSYTYQVREISNVDNGYKYRWITVEKTLPVSPQTQQ